MEEDIFFSTGLDGLDALLGGGLRPGSLTYLAGRPGMGCSCLLRQMQIFGDELVTVDAEASLPPGKLWHFPDLGGAAAQLRALGEAARAPVVCGAKLLRFLEFRKDKRPTLEDFVQSCGKAAADAADVILLLYRDAYYHDVTHEKGDDTAELFVVKNAFGPTGAVKLHWSREPEWAPLLFWQEWEDEGKTYVMSDLHGRCDLYRQMLKTIGFSERDELYILGDAIDRGEDGIDLLLDLMERPNVHLLLGDHEDMARTILWEYTFAQDGEYLKSAAFTEKTKRWMEDGGEATLSAFQRLDWWEQERIVVYLYSLPYRKELTLNGLTYHLSHTLPDKPPVMEDAPKRDFLWGELDYRICCGTGKTFITGHTPTHLIDPAYRGRIWRGNGHVAIDCAAVCGGALGCICLETQEEYYE